VRDHVEVNNYFHDGVRLESNDGAEAGERAASRPDTLALLPGHPDEHGER